MMSTDYVSDYIFPFISLSEIEVKHLTLNVELSNPIFDLNHVLRFRNMQLINSEDSESDLALSVSMSDNNSSYSTLEEIPDLQNFSK